MTAPPPAVIEYQHWTFVLVNLNCTKISGTTKGEFLGGVSSNIIMPRHLTITSILCDFRLYDVLLADTHLEKILIAPLTRSSPSEQDEPIGTDLGHGPILYKLTSREEWHCYAQSCRCLQGNLTECPVWKREFSRRPETYLNFLIGKMFEI